MTNAHFSARHPNSVGGLQQSVRVAGESDGVVDTRHARHLRGERLRHLLLEGGVDEPREIDHVPARLHLDLVRRLQLGRTRKARLHLAGDLAILDTHARGAVAHELTAAGERCDQAAQTPKPGSARPGPHGGAAAGPTGASRPPVSKRRNAASTAGCGRRMSGTCSKCSQPPPRLRYSRTNCSACACCAATYWPWMS